MLKRRNYIGASSNEREYIGPIMSHPNFAFSLVSSMERFNHISDEVRACVVIPGQLIRDENIACNEYIQLL